MSKNYMCTIHGLSFNTTECEQCSVGSNALRGKAELSVIIDHPPHYNQGRFETIDVIEDWGLGFNDGNALKYISRSKHKGTPKQDLEKAVWYLKREIKKLETEQQ